MLPGPVFGGQVKSWNAPEKSTDQTKAENHSESIRIVPLMTSLSVVQNCISGPVALTLRFAVHQETVRGSCSFAFSSDSIANCFSTEGLCILFMAHQGINLPFDSLSGIP